MKLPDLIQMISALSEMRWRQDQAAIERERMATSQHQFGMQYGLSAQNSALATQQEHRVGLDAFLKHIDDGTPKTRAQIIAMGHSYGLTEEELQHATQYAADAPMTGATIADMGATHGYEALEPGVRADWEHETAARALTGVGVDQLAQNHLAGAIAAGAKRQLEDMSPTQAAPFYHGQLDQMTRPLEGAVHQMILNNPATLGNYTAIQAGQQGTWAEIEGLRAQQDLLKFNTAKALGPPSAYQRSMMMSRIGNMIRVMRDPKTSRDARWMLGGLVNQMGREVGMNGDIVPNPDQMEGAGMWEQFENSIVTPDMGGYSTPSFPQSPTPGPQGPGYTPYP